MPLPGKKPTDIKKRFKLFLYGDAGTGKSTTAINFPKPYYIDTEGGCQNPQYIKILNENDAWVYESSDFDDVYKAVKLLMTEKHDYLTLVIDSITGIYENLLAHCAITEGGTGFNKHVKKADPMMKSLVNLLLKIDMNVVITAHETTKWKDEVSFISYDSYKKQHYMFDLTLRLKCSYEKRQAYIEKSRVEGFKQYETIDFDYKELIKRYSGGLLTKEVEVVDFASQESLEELYRLIALFNVPETETKKWLKKDKCEDFEEMSADHVAKCIESLKLRTEGEKIAA